MISAARGGSAVAISALMPLVYEQLKKQAGFILLSERANHSLQPTALVHEACLRLLGPDDLSFQDKAHFLAMAAGAMRRILVDHARKRHAGKRWDPNQRVDLTENIEFHPNRPEQFLALDHALARLEEFDPRLSKIVELHFFGGLTFDEIAEVVQLTARTVQRDWGIARLWLHRQLVDGS